MHRRPVFQSGKLHRETPFKNTGINLIRCHTGAQCLSLRVVFAVIGPAPLLAQRRDMPEFLARHRFRRLLDLRIFGKGCYIGPERKGSLFIPHRHG